jgi:hypothetical protein
MEVFGSRTQAGLLPNGHKPIMTSTDSVFVILNNFEIIFDAAEAYYRLYIQRVTRCAPHLRGVRFKGISLSMDQPGLSLPQSNPESEDSPWQNLA